MDLLSTMSILGKWSLLISLGLCIFGLIYLSDEEEKEELDIPDFIKGDDKDFYGN